MNAPQTYEVKAAKIAREVRDYVRDRFTPGTLSSLNELELVVTEKILKMKES